MTKVFDAILEKAKLFRESHGNKPDFKDLLIVVNRKTYQALQGCLEDKTVYIGWTEPEDSVNIECDWFNELHLNDGEVSIVLR